VSGITREDKNAMSNAGVGEVVIGALAIDYLNVVTPSIQAAEHVFHAVTYRNEEPIIGSLYGNKYISATCGPFRLATIPRQKADNGRMVSVSGASAHYYAGDLAGLLDKGHISRIDLQVTVPLNTPVNLDAIYEILSTPSRYPWKQTGKAPYCQFFTNTDGGETIYIGKRTSDLMTRIYRKTIEGIECLRWELEIKGRLARGLQEQNVIDDPNVRATFARAVLAGYPDALQHQLAMFSERIDEPTGELIRHRAETSDEATLQWFRTTVVPALKKAMRGKLREEVLELLREQDYYLTSYEEYDRLMKEREKKQRETERKFKSLYEGARTR
jgi:hypothetical protein